MKVAGARRAGPPPETIPPKSVSPRRGLNVTCSGLRAWTLHEEALEASSPSGREKLPAVSVFYRKERDGLARPVTYAKRWQQALPISDGRGGS